MIPTRQILKGKLMDLFIGYVTAEGNMPMLGKLIKDADEFSERVLELIEQYDDKNPS